MNQSYVFFLVSKRIRDENLRQSRKIQKKCEIHIFEGNVWFQQYSKVSDRICQINFWTEYRYKIAELLKST